MVKKRYGKETKRLETFLWHHYERLKAEDAI